MNHIQSFILGVLQGITEWLPISSQGQSVLILLHFMHIEPENALSVALFLHIGTALAVLIRFREDFLSMLNPESKLLKIVVVASLSSGITALPLLLFIKNVFETGEIATVLIGITLILTGLILGVQKRSGSSYRSLDEITTKDMVFAGLAQGLSILPGISRSGTTITLLLMRGIKQDLALRLSFLMSVPAVLGAVIGVNIWSTPAIALSDAAIMILTSLIAGYVAMSVLLRFATKVNFAAFCVSLGALTILLSQLPILF